MFVSTVQQPLSRPISIIQSPTRFTLPLIHHRHPFVRIVWRVLNHCRALTLHENAGPFNIASGAILGIGAGLLWTAQGSLMLAYPTENNKGKFIAIFWSIFNMGGVVGAAVSLGQNYDSSVSTALLWQVGVGYPER